jgi:hypothetical protein
LRIAEFNNGWRRCQGNRLDSSDSPPNYRRQVANANLSNQLFPCINADVVYNIAMFPLIKPEGNRDVQS